MTPSPAEAKGLRAAIVPVTPFQQNCTLLWDSETKAGAVVDPGGDLDEIQKAIAEIGISVEKIILTHGHIDHAGGAHDLRDALGVTIEGPHPADKFLLDMMREIHRYFEFPKSNRMAVGLGGGHSGFTVCALHVLTVHDAAQHVYIDTPAPESDLAKASGFFRQSWGAQIIEMMRHAKGGDESRLHFATAEGAIPSSDMLERLGIKVFFGVGHETTGATTYSRADILNLLDWIDRNPAEHHAVLDATSMLGAMPWGAEIVAQVMAKCCLFMPFQKAIGGISGYFLVSFTPQALALVEENQKQPSWAIPRQLKLAAPVDPKMPLTGERSVRLGPIYDPAQNIMVGGVINTFSTLAFAETTFARPISGVK